MRATSSKGAAADGLRFWKPDGLATWPWLRAVVTTRRGGTSQGPFASLNLGLSSGDDAERVLANRDRVRLALGLAAPQIHTLHQVHGTRILEAPWSGSEDADGSWTEQPGRVLVVGIADCVPVFVWDARLRRVALVHAGWRGTAAGILAEAVALLQRRGSQPGDLWVSLGPSIGPCCYSVSADVAARFPAEARRDGAGGIHLDLRVANRLQAEGAGVPPGQVQDAPPCTGCNAATFYSYRKEGGRTGRMWALLWMRNPAGPNGAG